MHVPGHVFSVHSQIPLLQVLDISEMVENTKQNSIFNAVIKYSIQEDMLILVHRICVI